MVELINKKGKCSICKKEFELLVWFRYEFYCIDDYTRKIIKEAKEKVKGEKGKKVRK